MTTPYHPRPERWPQVSLKGFFVAVTFLWIGLCWLAVQVKWIKDRHAAIESIQSQPLHLIGTYSGTLMPIEANAPWSIRLLGERGYDYLALGIDSDPGVRDERERELKRLFPEAEIYVVSVIAFRERWRYLSDNLLNSRVKRP